MALWDALARTHGTSLVRLLGGVERPQRVYGAVGYDGAAGAARTAAAWAARGFTGVKAKIGYPDVQEDLAVVRAIREAVGPSVAIMVDYNQSLTPADAIGRIRVLEGEGLAWVEEPTLAHDFEGHAQVAQAVDTPIQCGENWWGPQDMAHAIRARASDVVMPDVMKMLGVTGWLKAATLAEAAGLRVSTHLWSEVSAQLLSPDADGALARVLRLVEPDPGGAAARRAGPVAHRGRRRHRRRVGRGRGAAMPGVRITVA